MTTEEGGKRREAEGREKRKDEGGTRPPKCKERLHQRAPATAALPPAAAAQRARSHAVVARSPRPRPPRAAQVAELARVSLAVRAAEESAGEADRFLRRA